MSKNSKIIEMEGAVVKFVGDSGDGMQLIGTLFSETVATDGNDLATFPDYPAEVRAPHNTIAGVSGFQVHFGSQRIYSSGDLCDVLVTMNPASLKANLKWAKKGAIVVVDNDMFDDKTIERAGYVNNPLEDGSLKEYNIVKAPVTSSVKALLSPLGIDNKSAEKTRNMFTLGVVYYIFDRKFDTTLKYIAKKFSKKNAHLIDANKMVMTAGYTFAETCENIDKRIKVSPAPLEKGKYTNITGNIATAWGLLAASERSGRQLFLGSYPITPATEILIELAKHKELGAKVFQAEDEIAGICSAIGASFTGSMACTTTSGPGLSLKSEAIGLAVIAELPLIIVNVQRGGPSTGLPTKSEQSDLYQALFGRNGEAPVIIIAATTASDCFYAAYEAAKLSMEHMTPVILLTDGNLGQGSQLFKIPSVKNLTAINPPIAKANDKDYQPYRRNPETHVRQWAIPGTEGLRHRIGGLEKEDGIGNVSMDPMNHQKMTDLRAAKVQKIADFIPEQEIVGDKEGDLLVISWGGTFGPVHYAVQEMRKAGKKVSHAHFRYIMPLPKNTESVFAGFKKIVVCELNAGQFVNYLRMNFPQYPMSQYNKVQGLPFLVSELSACFNQILEVK